MTGIGRVTQTSIATLTVNNLQSNLSRIQTIQGKLSSGKELNRPSDGPSETSAALEYRAEVRRPGQYSRNIQDGLDRLGVADSTLTSMIDEVRRAHDLAQQGSNASMSSEERQALAAEVDTIRDSLIGQANAGY